MKRCEVCKKDKQSHLDHDMNLKFNFCTSCAPWLQQHYFNNPSQIIKGTSAQKLLKDKKMFRQFWQKIYHHVYQFDSYGIEDILLAHATSESEMDYYEKRLDELDEKGYNMYHNKTTLKGHFVYWTIVQREGM